MDGARTYYVQRSDDGGFSLAHEYPGTSATQYRAGGLECPGSYHFRVVAYGNGTTHQADFGPLSRWVFGSIPFSICIVDPPDDPPSAPRNVVIYNPTKTSIQVRWRSVTGASKYKVQRSDDGGLTWGYDAETTSTQVDMVGLTCGTGYHFRVLAYGNGTTHQAVYGNPSGSEFGSTEGCNGDSLEPPPAPTGVDASIIPGTGTNPSSVELVWTALPGVASYKIERSDDGSDTWPQPDDDNYADNVIEDIRTTQYTVTEGLGCQTYAFRVSAKGDGSTYAAVYGTPTVARFVPISERSTGGEETTKKTGAAATARATTGAFCLFSALRLDAPEIDVIPLPQRKARLTWARVDGATGYIVQRRELYGAWPTSGSPNYYTIDNPPVGDLSHGIILDRVIQTSVGPPPIYKGLADAPYAYEFQVQAVDENNSDNDSGFTRVTIVDSPIKSVNGDSSEADEDKGKMVVTWRPMFNNARYTVRWRKLRGRHAGQVFWSPISWIEGDRNSEYDWQSGATTAALSATYESADLERGEIYAVQLNFTANIPHTEGTHQFYSAREAYVWVSARAGGVYGGGVYGELIGGMPLGRALDDILAPNYRTYFYRICEDTFNPVSQRSDWAVLIEAALEEWELATDGMVVMTLDGYTVEEVANDPDLDASKVGKSKPCAQYTQVINDIRVGVEGELAASSEETVSREMIERVVSNLHYHADFLNEDLRYNEIIMYDDRLMANEPVEFSELGAYIGFFWCGKEVPMCAYTPEAAWSVLSLEPGRLFTYPFHTRDIAISQSYFEANDEFFSVSRPDVTFNVCTTLVDYKYYTYYGIVHEGGHVLGIVGHPAQRDSVMNGFADEPGCSPHPLDIMAIYALYQSRD